MKFTIRQTKNKDLIKDLHEQTLPGDMFYEHDGNVYWVVMTDTNHPAGFCIGTDLGHGIMFLSRAGVLKRYRGQGLHKRMIKLREQQAKRMGLKDIITYTTKDNYSSFSHLIKEGYLFYTPEYGYAGPNVFYFIKHI